MNRLIATAVTAVAVAAVFGGYTLLNRSPVPIPLLSSVFESSASFQYEPPDPGSYQLPPIKAAPAGQLIDHSASPVQLSSLLRGKFSLVSFVYLNCQDTQGCPVAMSTLWQLHGNSKKLPTLRNDLQLVTVSFDPDRDTPEKLNQITQTMQADNEITSKLQWHMLTSRSPKAISPILGGFGQTIGRTSDPAVINHLLRLYLVDRQGRIRNVYGLGSIDPRLIITDVQTLLMQEAQGQQS